MCLLFFFFSFFEYGNAAKEKFDNLLKITAAAVLKSLFH